MTPAHSTAISARPASLAFGVVMGFLPGEVAHEYTATGTAYQPHARPAFRGRPSGGPRPSVLRHLDPPGGASFHEPLPHPLVRPFQVPDEPGGVPPAIGYAGGAATPGVF